MITALGGGAGGTTNVVSSSFGNILSATIRDTSGSCRTSYADARTKPNYTFRNGDTVRFPVGLQKDGQNFTIASGSSVRYALVNKAVSEVVIGPKVSLESIEGSNWQNSLIVCEFTSAETQPLAPMQLDLEIEVSDSSSTNTFFVTGILVSRGYIV